MQKSTFRAKALHRELELTANSRRRAFAQNVDFCFIVSGSDRTFTFRVSTTTSLTSLVSGSPIHMLQLSSFKSSFFHTTISHRSICTFVYFVVIRYGPLVYKNTKFQARIDKHSVLKMLYGSSNSFMLISFHFLYFPYFHGV